MSSTGLLRTARLFRTKRSHPSTIPVAAGPVTRTMATLGLVLLAGAASANPPVDEMKKGLCLDFKVNGMPKPCNNDLRLVDDGKGEVTFVTGYGEARGTPTTVVAFDTAQVPDLENAYGYALRITAVTLMTYDHPDSRRVRPATGLCFMVKPNPERAGTRPVKPDIVVMCSATLSDAKAEPRRLDWKFVF